MPEQTIRVTPLEWAIAMHEGAANLHGGRPYQFAVKREGIWRDRLAAKGVAGTELGFQCRSWGVWQIMGVVLREHGFKGDGPGFCADLAVQLDFMRREWRRKVRAIPARSAQPWRLIESWNKGSLGALRLSGPTDDYYGEVDAWLKRAPLPGNDGLVDLVCKG